MKYNEMPLTNSEILRFIIGIITIGIICGFLFYNNIFKGLLLSTLLLLYFKRYKRNIINNRRSEMLSQFKDLLYSISASMACGRSMSQALEESIEFWKSTYDGNDFIMIELNKMVSSIKNGNQNDIVVLRDFANRTNLDDVNDFVNVYETTKESGGNLIKAINRATTIIGDKIALEKELKTKLKEKLFEGRIVAISPFLILFFLKITSPDYLSLMYQTTKGNVISTFSLILIGFSYLLIEKITNIEI